jgi:hypothetical protein
VPEYEVVLVPSPGYGLDPTGSWKPYDSEFELEKGDVITIHADTRIYRGGPMILQARVTVVENEPPKITVQSLGAPISNS